MLSSGPYNNWNIIDIDLKLITLLTSTPEENKLNIRKNSVYATIYVNYSFWIKILLNSMVKN